MFIKSMPVFCFILHGDIKMSVERLQPQTTIFRPQGEQYSLPCKAPTRWFENFGSAISLTKKEER
jgi:hypothetical protein